VCYTTTALRRNDIIDTPTNKDVVDGGIVELNDYGGNVVTIYGDINCANPETQKTCDTNGQCTFFAEAGDYVLEVNGRPQNITISVNITVVNDVSSQRIWGDRYKGELTTDVGVTLTDEFSVLLYDGNYYSYTGSDPFPVIVAPGTVPTAPDYKLRNPTDHDSDINRNAVGAHDDIYIRTVTLAEAIAEDAPIGTGYSIDDVFYKVVDISESGGFYASLNATKKLEINLNQSSIPASLINSITVGSGCNFLTITDALDLCRKIKVYSQNKNVNISLLSGFELNEQVVISGADLSYCIVTSEDATVNVNANVWTLPIQEGGYTPAITARFGAISPLFNVVFDAGEDASSDESKAGFVAGGFGKILSSGGINSGEHLGFINLNGRGLYCFQNGEAQANYSELNNNYVGHRCSNNSRSQIRLSNLNNCSLFSIMCDSSYINASQATVECFMFFCNLYILL